MSLKQFVFMSSIIVYGDSSSNRRVITRETVPTPSNDYGRSKLQAEQGITPLESDSFKVVILRSPMVYGKGSKGNYSKLAKLAKKLSIFPDIDNERSMIHIDNLCEFVRLMIDNEERGLFFPQNNEYVKTSEMMRLIAEAHGKRVRLVKWFNGVLRAASGRLSVVNKAFGNLAYEHEMSLYDKANYRIRDFRESIELSESDARSKKVLILVNHDVVIYNFRRELVERLLGEGYEVVISSPYGERIDPLVEMGCQYIETVIDRRGTNPLRDVNLLRYYRRIMVATEPDVVLTYTIKPNVYGGIAARSLKIVYIANITGLGTAVEKAGWRQKVSIFLYKIALRNVHRVFQQNALIMEFH